VPSLQHFLRLRHKLSMQLKVQQCFAFASQTIHAINGSTFFCGCVTYYPRN
jgi:hypothetical protein